MIPLASDLPIRFREQMRWEGLLVSASLPNRLSSSGRIAIVVTISRKCLEAIVVPVDKIASRCKRATERAGQRAAELAPLLQQDPDLGHRSVMLHAGSPCDTGVQSKIQINTNVHLGVKHSFSHGLSH
jgi:hypothetical protein